MTRIDFSRINKNALPLLSAILSRLLPGGKFQGGEYVALNPLRSDKQPGSFRINVRTGRWADFATGDKGGDVISLVAYLTNESQSEAARHVAEMIGMKI